MPVNRPVTATADDGKRILDTIDGALSGYEASKDAMRWPGASDAAW